MTEGSGNPSVSFADSIPQFSMVVPLRSQARLWHSLLHWAYSALFRAQRARFVRPSPSLARCSVSSHCAAVGGPVFRRCAPPSPSAARCSGVADALWACARASSRFAASNGQRSGRECIFTFRTALRFACAVFRRCGRPLGVSSRLQPFGPSPFRKHLLCKKCQK